MATIGDIYDCIDAVAPFRNADSFDNSGLLVGNKKDKVTKILLSLDVTLAVAEEAKALGCELVVTHHPVLFSALKKLDITHPGVRLVSFGIGCISAHTNLDSADYNISDIMLEKLGLKACDDSFVSVNRFDSVTGKPVGYGRVADCDKISPRDLAIKAKEAFGCDFVRFIEGNSDITKLAVCSGAGGDFARDAINCGAQALVTADIKHHEMLEASDLGLTIIDCGHYNTEVIALEYLKKLLLDSFEDVEVIISHAEDNLIKTV